MCNFLYCWQIQVVISILYGQNLQGNVLYGTGQLMLARRLPPPEERKRIRLYGEEIKIRAKQSSDYYFAIRRR